MNDGETRILRAVVRRSAPWTELQRLGIEIAMTPARCEIKEPPELLTFPATISDLASGLLVDQGTSRDWARVMLGCLCIDLGELEGSAAGEHVLELLWHVAENQVLGVADRDFLQSIIRVH